MALFHRLATLLDRVYRHPHLLRGCADEHERSFERLLWLHGIFPSTFGYQRHPHGSQRWPDFHVTTPQTLVPIELKTTSRALVHLGQTWPAPEGLYVVTQRPKGQTPRSWILWGRDIVEKEGHAFRTFHHHLKSLPSHRVFASPLQWSASYDITYRLEEHRRHTLYRSVVDDLRRL
jgi:hypothetical protein